MLSVSPQPGSAPVRGSSGGVRFRSLSAIALSSASCSRSNFTVAGPSPPSTATSVRRDIVGCSSLFPATSRIVALRRICSTRRYTVLLAVSTGGKLLRIDTAPFQRELVRDFTGSIKKLSVSLPGSSVKIRRSQMMYRSAAMFESIRSAGRHDSINISRGPRYAAGI